jgi:hypothetical protein
MNSAVVWAPNEIPYKLNGRVKCTVTSCNVFAWNLMLIIFGQILLSSAGMVILNTCWVCCEI